MGSKLDLVLDQIRADQQAAVNANPLLDTEAIFLEAQKNAAIERLFTIPPLTPEAAATPAVVIEPQDIQPRKDLTRLIQPVTIKGH